MRGDISLSRSTCNVVHKVIWLYFVRIINYCALQVESELKWSWRNWNGM